jgi:hypothetical protein
MSSARSFALAFTLPLLLASVVAGCGSKSDLAGRIPRPRLTDAGTPDLGPERDGGEPDGGPRFLEVDCGRREQYTSPRRPIALTATITASSRLESRVWTLTSTPEGSTPSITPADEVVGVEPDLAGDYGLHFEVRDVDGLSATCDVIVHSIVGPPAAICPEDPITTSPNVPVLVLGDGYDDVRVVSYAWRIASSPASSSPRIAPVNVPETTFVSDLEGEYGLELTVADEDGGTGTCIAQVIVNGGPSVTCPASPISAPTRRPVALTATATSETGPVTTRWHLVTRPTTSAAVNAPLTGLSTTFTPDKVGAYLLRFTATDTAGLEASCEVTVNGTPTPPDAICPPVIETTPMSTVEISGSGVDDGIIVSYLWESVDIPPGSSALPPAPPSAATTRFSPDVAGDYALRLTVTDDNGQTDTCTTTVRALVAEGLRVELYWNPPDNSCHTNPGVTGCDSTDVDLHLLHPAAPAWFNSTYDCYYATCDSRSMVLPWWEWELTPPVDDIVANNARLDLDETNGFGPENINIDTPKPATYRVGVDFFSDHGREGRPAAVYVNIYCGVGSSTPIAAYGPVSMTNRQFWKVADVTVGSAGCRVADLSVGGRPTLVTNAEAQAAR